MESKLEQLTQKLYEEGLSKGRTQAQELLSKAEADAARIVAKAEADAASILATAEAEVTQLRTNTENEIRMAGVQMESALRARVGEMVVSGVAADAVSAAWADGSFVRQLVLEAVGRWNPNSDNELQVVVPEAADALLVGDLRTAVSQKFGQGVEVVTDSRVKVPFRIAPKGGGYYVSFADQDFRVLLGSYLRPRVQQLLFGEQDKTK